MSSIYNINELNQIYLKDTELYLPCKPSLSYLLKSWVRARAYTVNKGVRETVWTRKSTVYPPISYFVIGRSVEGYSQSP